MMKDWRWVGAIVFAIGLAAVWLERKASRAD